MAEMGKVESSMHPNRRAGERGSLKCPVEVRVGDNPPLRGHTQNVSATGSLLVLPCEIPLGIEFRLSLELPDDLPPLELWAMAIRHAAGSDALSRPVRLGVTFILPPIDAVRRIRSL
ncbi:MAG TPA: PilZ domain-containing protein, partial [Acidobacteria bacterium]|nr:PilZ domain-containing protein [Acidobacteriota bacterium]